MTPPPTSGPCERPLRTFRSFLHSMDLLSEVLELGNVTLVAPLSREVGDAFLICSGNFSRRWLPKGLSHTLPLWRVSKRISRRYASHSFSPTNLRTGVAAGSI